MNNNVIEFPIPHKVFEAICIRCGKRWIECCPEKLKLKDIECPNCGKGFVIKTGEEIEIRKGEKE